MCAICDPDTRPLIYWYCTFRCNLSCRHCWVKSSPSSLAPELSTSEIRTALRSVAALVPSRIILSGGEPLLRKDIDVILEAVAEIDVPLSLETNATLITPSIAARLAEVHERSGCWISVSLDGGTAEAHEALRGAGAFRAAMIGLERLMALHIPLGIQCVLTQANYRTIPDLFRLAQEFGMTSKDRILAFALLSRIGRGRDNYDDLAMDYHEWNQACRLLTVGLETSNVEVLVKTPPAVIPTSYLARLLAAGRAGFLTQCAFPVMGVLPDGSLSLCALTGADDALRLGHVLTDDLGRVLRERIAPLRVSYEGRDLTGTCGDCVFRSTCRGGCRAVAYVECGSFSAPHPVCAAYDREGLFPAAYRLSYHNQLRAKAEEANT
jgi:radical SAM protein with 4Fe4S-binding SPASM domain